MIAAELALQLEWILLDVDGVLTDGRLFYGPRGEEIKVFDVSDGLALKLAQRAGLKVGLLSGRRTEAVLRRATELGLDDVQLGQSDKDHSFAEFLSRHEIGPEQVAYAGDDLPDLPVIRRVALSFAPRDAAPEVRDEATVTLAQPGGRGAVREMIVAILRARGAWDRLVEELF